MTYVIAIKTPKNTKKVLYHCLTLEEAEKHVKYYIENGARKLIVVNYPSAHLVAKQPDLDFTIDQASGAPERKPFLDVGTMATIDGLKKDKRELLQALSKIQNCVDMLNSYNTISTRQYVGDVIKATKEVIGK